MPLSINTPRPEMPIDVGGELIVSAADTNTNVNYTIRVFPAANNEELQLAGQPMKFYFCPDRVFLANNPDGNYKFQLLTFQGEFSENANAGVAANASMAGGVCTFTSTMRIPEHIMVEMDKKLKEKITGDARFANHRLFRFRNAVQPVSLIPVSMIDSQVLVHNLDLAKITPQVTQEALGEESFVFDVQGNGPGSTSYAGENAFTATMGMTQAALMQGAMLEGGKTPLTAQYAYKYKIAASAYKIEIHCDWKSVYHHFSSQFKANLSFAALDMQRVFEELTQNGTIQVKVKFDEEFIDKDEEKFLRDHKDEVLNRFIDIGTKAIFDVQPPQVAPAQAKEKSARIKKFLFWTVGVDAGLSYAMKKVDQIKTIDLDFEETVDKTVIRSNQASGNFTEIREAVKKDATKVDLYFSKIFLADAFKIVYVAAHANAFWRTLENPNGDPIHSLSVQVSYPITQTGKPKVTKAAARYIDPLTGKLSDHETDATWTAATKDRVYIFRFDQQDKLPAEEQQKIEVIRTVSFQEDPNVITNMVTLQEVTEDHKIEVRAESSGKFGVSFSMENAEVLAATPRIKVLVTCQVDGMPDKVFLFDQKNALAVQQWNIWYAKQADIKPMKYKVDVALSGRTILDKMLKWGTNWNDFKLDTADGILSIPFPDIPEDMRAKAEAYLTADVAPAPVVTPQPTPVTNPQPVAGNGTPAPQPTPVQPAATGNGTPTPASDPQPMPVNNGQSTSHV